MFLQEERQGGTPKNRVELLNRRSRRSRSGRLEATSSSLFRMRKSPHPCSKIIPRSLFRLATSKDTPTENSTNSIHNSNISLPANMDSMRILMDMEELKGRRMVVQHQGRMGSSQGPGSHHSNQDLMVSIHMGNNRVLIAIIDLTWELESLEPMGLEWLDGHLVMN